LSDDDEIENAFGSQAPFSVGVEEELFLVDPVTGHQTNTSAAVLERLGPVDGQVEREVHACQIELITDVCESAAEAVGTLGGLRRAVLATGAGLLGYAVATPVSAIHIHVGMPDAETAIKAFNGMRGHLPLLLALAANSPFRHGRDTGLAASREVTLRGWPRSGVPRAMRDFADFCAATKVLVRAADVPDYTWFWWKLRPHPRLGTVEIRALDVQASLEDTAALVALVHCLARDVAEADPSPDPPGEVLEEGAFRAARFGVQACLPDAEGDLHSVEKLLAEALDQARPHAEDLGCADELELLPDLLARGGGAARQRAIYEIAGMDALLRELTEITGGSAPTR